MKTPAKTPEEISERKSELRSKMCHINRKFRRACQQVVLLNTEILRLKARYERSQKHDLRSFRYTQRIQVCVFEGVRNTFYDYASEQCDTLEGMQREFIRLHGYPFHPDWENEEEAEAGPARSLLSSSSSLNSSAARPLSTSAPRAPTRSSPRMPSSSCKNPRPRSSEDY